jgi:hypothetical protein
MGAMFKISSQGRWFSFWGWTAFESFSQACFRVVFKMLERKSAGIDFLGQG